MSSKKQKVEVPQNVTVPVPKFDGAWHQLENNNITRSATFVLPVPGGVLIRFWQVDYCGDNETENGSMTNPMVFLPGASLEQFNCK